MKMLTAAEMGAVDRRTAEEFGVALVELMEVAGRSVGEFCLRQYSAAMRVTVLCGKGNNGGDGFVAARGLAGAGRSVRVVLLGRMDEVRGDAAAALRVLRDEAPSAIVDEMGDEAGLEACADVLGDAELVIDAVVGTGFKPPLRGLAAALRETVEGLKVPVVAVDVPSGWDADSMEQTVEGAFRADAVVTFTAPKMAHVFGHLTASSKTGGTFGPVVVASIGSPSDAVASASGLSWAGDSKAIAEQPREINANKGKYGHVLVVGGSYGTAGAPSMASLAALRTGAGLVTAAVPSSIVNIVAGVASELMLAPLREGIDGALSPENLAPEGLDAVIKQKRISVVALGPGLSTRGDVSAFARELIAKTKLPLVVDADALNAFDGRAELLN